jgi:hypothetical protein
MKQARKTPRGRRSGRAAAAAAAQQSAATSLGTLEPATAAAPAAAPQPSPEAPASAPGTLIDNLVAAGGEDSRTNADAAAAAIDLVTMPTAGDAAPGAPGAAAPGADAGRTDRWSKTRLQRASTAQLRQRVRQLEDQVPEPKAGDVAADQAQIAADSEETRMLLGMVMPGLNDAVSFAAGEVWSQTPEETELLCKNLAPSLAPYYEQLRTRLPIAGALIVAAGIYLPKVIRHLKAEKVRNAEVAQPLADIVSAGTLPAVAVEPSRLQVQIEAPAQLSRPFGGPDE